MSEITSNVPLDTWDYGIVVSYVRITAPSGTFVARIGLSDNGLQSPRQPLLVEPCALKAYETSEPFFKLNAMECLSFHDSLLAFLRR